MLPKYDYQEESKLTLLFPLLIGLLFGGLGACSGIEEEDTCLDHCSNGAQDCGESGIDCGGECPDCPTIEDDASFDLQEVPSPVDAGKPFMVSITMKNIGTTTWTSSYALGSWNPADNTTWELSRIELSEGLTVAPAESHAFSAELLAPNAPGTYDMQWRMLREDSGWFGQPTAAITVQVEDPWIDPTTTLCLAGYSDYAVVTYTNAYNKHQEFLNRLASYGVNFTRVWIYGYSNWEQQEGKACGASWFEHLPFTRSGAGGKYDLTDFDPTYFTKLNTFLDHANEKQIFTMLTLFDSWALKNLGWPWNPWDDDYNIHGLIQEKSPCEILGRFFDLNDTTLMNIQKGYVEEVISQTQGHSRVLYEIMNEPLICQNLASKAAAWQQEVVSWIRAIRPHALIVIDDGAKRSDASCNNPYTSVGPTVSLSGYDILAPHWGSWGDASGNICISQLLSFLEPYGKHIVIDDDGCSVKEDGIKIRRLPEKVKVWSHEAIQNGASFNHLQDDLSCQAFTLPNADMLEAIGSARQFCPGCENHCNNSEKDCGEGGIDCGGTCPTVCLCEANHCTNDFRDCDEERVDCGGKDCAVCPNYECIKGCRNGDERCDDEKFSVPSPYVPMKLVCEKGKGGVMYVSRNSGPPTQPGNIPRCRGFEESNLQEWKLLEYVVKMDCTKEKSGMAFDIGLSSFAGKEMYVGVHDQPNGGGHMTEVCIAKSTKGGPDPCAEHCSNDVQDCGETGVDCGLPHGECTPCQPCKERVVSHANPGSGGSCVGSDWSGGGQGLLKCMAVDTSGTTAVRGIYRQNHKDGSSLFLSPYVDATDAVCQGASYLEIRLRVTKVDKFDRGYLEIGNCMDCPKELQFRVNASDLRGDELWTKVRFQLGSHASYSNIDWSDVSHLRFYWYGDGSGSNPDQELFSVYIDYVAIKP